MAEVDFNNRSETDNITQSMAQLLLKGWTMLSETCSQCTEVPLMRSKQGKLVCCKCSRSTEPKIPEKKQEEPSQPDSSVPKIRPYRTFGEVPLNGQELNSIHTQNHNLTVGPVQPLDTSLQKSHSDFQLGQLRLLEVQINKSLFRYSNLLSLNNDHDSIDIDMDGKIIKNLEGWLNLLLTIKKLF